MCADFLLSYIRKKTTPTFCFCKATKLSILIPNVSLNSVHVLQHCAMLFKTAWNSGVNKDEDYKTDKEIFIPYVVNSVTVLFLLIVSQLQTVPRIKSENSRMILRNA